VQKAIIVQKNILGTWDSCHRREDFSGWVFEIQIQLKGKFNFLTIIAHRSSSLSMWAIWRRTSFVLCF